MDNLHNDERISAYLDGELSADEQSRFEERLAESAELRQLVEELRALRGSLDLLPRHRRQISRGRRHRRSRRTNNSRPVRRTLGRLAGLGRARMRSVPCRQLSADRRQR